MRAAISARTPGKAGDQDDLGAERLERHHLQTRPAACRTDLVLVDVLGPDAQDDLAVAPGRHRRACRRSAATGPGCRTDHAAGRRARFRGGRPADSSAGSRESRRRRCRPGCDRPPCGGPTCTIRPWFMMQIRSPMVIASTWSWVTWMIGAAEPPVQLDQLGAHAGAQLGIEVGERLVEQERHRVADQRAAERHPLPLAAGQLRRAGGEQLVDARACAAVSRTRRSISARRMAADPHAEAEVARDASCAGTARSSGTRSRGCGPSGSTSLTLVLADAQIARGDRLRGRRSCAASSTCRSPRARAGS